MIKTPTRADLARFIEDPRTLRAFEDLFNRVNPTSGVVLAPGDLIWHGAATRVGALLANGAAVSRVTYVDLFTAIGIVYGAGDGSTTFNIPNVAAVSGGGATTVKAFIVY